jgi:hypothetical protein
MKQRLIVSMMTAAIAMTAIPRSAAAAEILRTVYFSAVDAKGAPVTDLTAADLVVKEGGKDRTIKSVEPASGLLQVSLLVDDGGTGAFQRPVAQFIETLLPHAAFAIRALNPQPMKLTDFTQDVNALRAAVNGIGQRGRVTTAGEQMMDAVGEAARELQQHKAARAAIVVLTVGGEEAQSTQAEPALDALKSSGASLSVIHLAGVPLGEVLGDGPKRSGGTIDQISGGVVLGGVLAKVASNLMHQYAVTYTLPDGVKPNDRFSLTSPRKGLKLLAPSRVPDR